MSFQPIISITNVPRDAKSFLFTDITGDSPTNPTGFGATNAPANRAAIDAVYGEAQLLGGEPIQSTSVTGTLAGTLTVNIPVADGVQWLRAYYGEEIALSFTVSSDRKTLTTADPTLAAKIDNVKAVGIDLADFPIRISSATSTTIILETPLPGVASSYTNIIRYWRAEVRILVLNCAESLIGNGIAKLPVSRVDCGAGSQALAILDKILLKLGAEYAFNCGNYSEAHQSAQMICGTSNSSSSNCLSCGN